MQNLPDFEKIYEDDEEPLVIHRHGDKPCQTLIIFLHGLGGKRYATWTRKGMKPAESSFPKFLHQDFDKLDIGLYAYRTLWGRLRFWKSIPLEQEATVLADRIRDLVRNEDASRYRAIILAGHSMGGILARAAVANLIQRSDRVALEAIKALFLLATPQAGSVRVPRMLSFLTSDSRALVAHGAVVTRIQETLTNHVVQEGSLRAPDRYYIPTYVVAGAEDNWVDRFSSGLGVRADFINTVRGSHTDTVKPRHKNDDTYSWVKGKLRALLAQLREPPNHFEDWDLAGKLLINRKTLRTNMRDMIDPEGRARILAVKGRPRCGKSHSIYFIEHVEQAGTFEKVVIELDQTGSPATFGPVDLARSVLELLQRDTSRIPEQTVGTTATRWVQTVAEHVVGHMKAKGGVILIVLDGFAHPSLPAPTRELVRELIRHVDRERKLRIVLLGCSDDLLLARADGRLFVETISDITDGDLRLFFTALADANDKELAPEALDDLVQDVRRTVEGERPYPPRGDESDNERVAQAVERWTQRLREAR
jgi:pimeloyl-ACP methyl ester carboxylesterase